MAKGGARPGAGRPPGKKNKTTIEKEALKEYLFEEFKKRKGSIVDALLRKAEEGDIASIKETLDRALGKVKDEVQVEGMEPVVVKVVSYKDKEE